jgi:hypothetical protein
MTLTKYDADLETEDNVLLILICEIRLLKPHNGEKMEGVVQEYFDFNDLE